MTQPNQHHLRGLHDEVSIRIDPWGIAHISAQNRDDLFFAQGWNAARDRLWQIDLARKRGLGLLAGDFGPGYLAQDRASRLLLYRGDMAQEWACYAPDAREICMAFVAGINAYVMGTRSGQNALPPEFALLGNQPDLWAPEDVVRIRSHSLTRNATSEILRARVLALMGPVAGTKLDQLRKKLEPAIAPTIAQGLDLDDLPDQVLRDFLLGVSPVSFSAERLAAPLQDAELWVQPTALGEIDRIASSEGSNNWVIGAHRSQSGRPILCLDPHRTHCLPSVRYMVHLTMPGFDAIGAGEAMVPGISMGHNGSAAFGLTIYGDDQEDLYVYDLHPDDQGLYRYDNQWEAITTLTETIPVRGHPDQQIELPFTRHGPVLYRHNGRAFGLRTVWTQPGSAPYMASLSVMRATSKETYLAALRGWGCPSVNHIYGDCAGDIVWKPSGASPIRDGWEGLLPVPGDGRFEWKGMMPASDTPVEINPARGYIATANAMNLPADWQGARPGYEWLDPSRHDFLNATLAENARVSLQDCAQMQLSLHSNLAVSLANWLQRPKMRSAVSPAILELLADFRGDLAPGSAAGALLEIWLSRHLGPAIARLEGANAQVLSLLAPYDGPALVDWLDQQSAAPPEIIASLDAAWRDCAQMMGAEARDWQWGQVHRLALRHPLQDLTSQDWSCPSIARGGSSSTANYAAYRTQDLAVTTGPSVRMMIDVGAWDNSLFINTPGQSGLPTSPHYRDLQPDWAAGHYHPLLYSRARVEAVATKQITLRPLVSQQH